LASKNPNSIFWVQNVFLRPKYLGLKISLKTGSNDRALKPRKFELDLGPWKIEFGEFGADWSWMARKRGKFWLAEFWAQFSKQSVKGFGPIERAHLTAELDWYFGPK